MKAPDFVYARAHSLDAAFKLKRQYGAEARWLAGGQSLLASLAFRLSAPSALIDISHLAELQGISVDGGVVRIGAGVTHATLGASEIIRTHVPLLAEAVPQIAHAAIRNRGTIGGSLALADPAAELPACCVALDATILVASARRERRIAAREFFTGLYATALAAQDLLVGIEIPVRQQGEQQTLVEIRRRSGDFAMAGVAVVLRRGAENITHARLVFFAAGDRPMIAEDAEKMLVGQVLDAHLIEDVATAAQGSLDPSDDLNGGAETKRHLAQVVLSRALTMLMNNDMQSTP